MFGLAKDRWPGAVHSQSQPLTLPPTDLPLGRTDSVGVSMETQMTCGEVTDANTKLVVMETTVPTIQMLSEKNTHPVLLHKQQRFHLSIY